MLNDAHQTHTTHHTHQKLKVYACTHRNTNKHTKTQTHKNTHTDKHLSNMHKMTLHASYNSRS